MGNALSVRLRRWQDNRSPWGDIDIAQAYKTGFAADTNGFVIADRHRLSRRGWWGSELTAIAEGDEVSDDETSRSLTSSPLYWRLQDASDGFVEVVVVEEAEDAANLSGNIIEHRGFCRGKIFCFDDDCHQCNSRPNTSAQARDRPLVAARNGGMFPPTISTAAQPQTVIRSASSACATSNGTSSEEGIKNNLELTLKTKGQTCGSTATSDSRHAENLADSEDRQQWVEISLLDCADEQDACQADPSKVTPRANVKSSSSIFSNKCPFCSPRMAAILCRANRGSESQTNEYLSNFRSSGNGKENKNFGKTAAAAAANAAPQQNEATSSSLPRLSSTRSRVRGHPDVGSDMCLILCRYCQSAMLFDSRAQHGQDHITKCIVLESGEIMELDDYDIVDGPEKPLCQPRRFEMKLPRHHREISGNEEHRLSAGLYGDCDLFWMLPEFAGVALADAAERALENARRLRQERRARQQLSSRRLDPGGMPGRPRSNTMLHVTDLNDQ